MNNATIILLESVKLMEEGKLKGSGNFITIETQNGQKEIEVPEAIHTYTKWKELGYQVKRGAKSEIKIPVWKYRGKTEIISAVYYTKIINNSYTIQRKYKSHIIY